MCVYTHTMECYSAIKTNEILPFAATWLEVESIVQNEKSHTEKAKYCMIQPICGIYNTTKSKLIDREIDDCQRSGLGRRKIGDRKPKI